MSRCVRLGGFNHPLREVTYRDGMTFTLACGHLQRGNFGAAFAPKRMRCQSCEPVEKTERLSGRKSRKRVGVSA